jgi:hypothetical protein
VHNEEKGGKIRSFFCASLKSSGSGIPSRCVGSAAGRGAGWHSNSSRQYPSGAIGSGAGVVAKFNISLPNGLEKFFQSKRKPRGKKSRASFLETRLKFRIRYYNL